MSERPGESIGLYFEKDEDILEEFDKRLEYGASRNKEIKKAMTIRTAMADVFAEYGEDLNDKSIQETRLFLTSALRHYFECPEAN